MGKPLSPKAFFVVSALLLSVAGPLRAATIFDNSANDLLTRFTPGTNEVGDEILLAGTERYITGFSFEFWATNTVNPTSFDGTIQARVRFYANDGAAFNGYATPGSTSFFDSGWFTIPFETYRSTLVFSEGSDFPAGGTFIPIPITASNMTWSVQFQGIGANDQVGVDLYSPPVVGSDYPDYWQYDGGNWILLTNTVAMDFAARMDANANIPEPSVVTLSLVGGLGILGFARRLRRNT